MIVVAIFSTINSFYVIINSAIVVNSLRVPMIMSFAFKENNSTIYRSRVKRQEWERQNALHEKQKRIQAIHDNQETHMQIFERKTINQFTLVKFVLHNIFQLYVLFKLSNKGVVASGRAGCLRAGAETPFQVEKR